MQKINQFFKGYKTYISAALFGLIGLLDFLAGDATLIEFLKDESVATAIAALRSGIANK